MFRLATRLNSRAQALQARMSLLTWFSGGACLAEPEHPAALIQRRRRGLNRVEGQQKVLG